MLFPSAGAAMRAGALAGGEEPTPTIVLVKGDRVQLAPGPSTPGVPLHLLPAVPPASGSDCLCAAVRVVFLFFLLRSSSDLLPQAWADRHRRRRLQGPMRPLFAVLQLRARDKLRLVCAQDHGDATPFKVRAQDNGRSSWFGRQHLAHA